MDFVVTVILFLIAVVVDSGRNWRRVGFKVLIPITHSGVTPLWEVNPNEFFGLLPILTRKSFSTIARMKIQTRFMLFGGMCLCLGMGSAWAQNQTINIMPMGDSVTARGSAPESSYRYWLYTYLTKAGFTNIQFVGQSTGVSDGAPANSWPQEAYEGGQGEGAPAGGDAWTTGTGVQDAPGAAARLGTGPAILLLDLGANDETATEFGETPLKTNLLQVRMNLETIIQTFHNANSSTIILLAVPTPWVPSSPDDQIAKHFMADIGGTVHNAAQNQKKAGVQVIVVNLHGGFNARIGRDTQDGAHPDIKGEQLIAKRFFNALRPVLKKMKKEGL